MLQDHMLEALILHTLYVGGAIAVIASLGWWLVLRLLDCMAGGWGHYKRNVIPVVHRDPLATAIIYGCRSLSIAIIFYAAFAAMRVAG